MILPHGMRQIFCDYRMTMAAIEYDQLAMEMLDLLPRQGHSVRRSFYCFEPWQINASSFGEISFRPPAHGRCSSAKIMLTIREALNGGMTAFRE